MLGLQIVIQDRTDSVLNRPKTDLVQKQTAGFSRPKIDRVKNRPKIDRVQNRPKIDRVQNRPKIDRVQNKPKIDRVHIQNRPKNPAKNYVTDFVYFPCKRSDCSGFLYSNVVFLFCGIFSQGGHGPSPEWPGGKIRRGRKSFHYPLEPTLISYSDKICSKFLEQCDFFCPRRKMRNVLKRFQH